MAADSPLRFINGPSLVPSNRYRAVCVVGENVDKFPGTFISVTLRSQLRKVNKPKNLAPAAIGMHVIPVLYPGTTIHISFDVLTSVVPSHGSHVAPYSARGRAWRFLPFGVAPNLGVLPSRAVRAVM